ncbi:hypothetical protein SPD48_06330 [Pseudogracilibacillus sp. SE30717A]|uniref:hypothetical protein n=1 Tax=Pseudogracilibacillus sp. SE30717A TaxID=3098293 RepID=UPI00300E68CB
MSFAVLVKERETYYPTFEKRMETFISSYFKEFLEGFFPNIFQLIEFKILRQVKKPAELQHIPLVVYQTKENGIDSLVYVLIDRGNINQTEINKQMYRVFNKLYKHYRLPIIPMLISFRENHLYQEEYEMSFYNMGTLTFQYSAVQIQKQCWRKYVKANHLIAAALFQYMDFPEDEKVQLHFEILKMLARIHSNPAEQRLLYDLFSEGF